MIVKPATKEILDNFYGHYPSMKAIAVMDGDKCLGVGGVYLEEGRYILFSDMTEELKQSKSYKRTLVKAYRALLKLLKTTKLSVFAHACEFAEGSETLLEHIGFEHVQGRVYRWRG